jgi:hypothetical protein
VESLRSVANVMADFVHAPAGRQEERLLSARTLIQAAIERGIRRCADNGPGGHRRGASGR